MATTAGAEEIRPMHRNTRIVLEGGSIDVNGEGTLLTTEECLLSKVQQRNPNMQRKDYEKIFANYLGAPHVIWLGKGIVGDDTHGHVDDLTRFVAPDTVVTMVEPNPKDANHKPLRDNLRRLQSATDQNGKPLNIVELPMPAPVIFEHRRLPASYANFYIANGIVLVPVFNDPNDRIALNTLAALFPTREVVPIYSGDLVWGLGTMHCMTQQQPLPNSSLREFLPPQIHGADQEPFFPSTFCRILESYFSHELTGSNLTIRGELNEQIYFFCVCCDCCHLFRVSSS